MSFNSMFLRTASGWVAVNCLVRLAPQRGDDWLVVYNRSETTTATDADIKLLVSAMNKSRHVSATLSRHEADC